MDGQAALRGRVADPCASRLSGSAVLRSAVAVCLITAVLALAPEPAGAQLPPAPTRLAVSYIIEPELTGPEAYWDPCWTGSGSGEGMCVFMQATGRHTGPLNCAIWDFGPRVGDLVIRVFVPKRNATATVTYNLEHRSATTGEVTHFDFELPQSELSGWKAVHLLSNASSLKLMTCNNSAREGIATHGWFDRLIGIDVVEVTCWARCDTDPDAPERPQPLVWQSAGDSYSSGLSLEPYYEQVGSNEDGYCKRSERAYGPAAADILRQRGWEIDPADESMTACSGHHVEQYFNDYKHDLRDPKRALWVQGWLDQLAPKRADVLVMSFGGNDIGFNDWLALYDGGHIDRLDNLLDPEKRCEGLRYEKKEPDRYICDLKIDGDTRGGIDEFYVNVVKKALTDTGQLYIVGYPNIIAPYDEWPTRFFGRIKECTVLSLFLVTGDAKSDVAGGIEAIATYLNLTLMRAVGRANAELGEVRVHYLDLYKLYRTGQHQTIVHTSEYGRDIETHPTRDYGTGGSHEHCGKKETETWMRGLGRSSFHPNGMGHKATAKALADLIADTHPYIDQAEAYKSYFE